MTKPRSAGNGKVTFTQSFGGREKYYSVKYKKDWIGDCAIRALAHGTGEDYIVVYKELFEMAMKIGDMPNADKVTDAYLRQRGWTKNTTMKKMGKRVRLKDWPTHGTYIIRMNYHVTCIKDGVHLDMGDWRSRCGNTYWTPPLSEK